MSFANELLACADNIMHQLNWKPILTEGTSFATMRATNRNTCGHEFFLDSFLISGKTRKKFMFKLHCNLCFYAYSDPLSYCVVRDLLLAGFPYKLRNNSEYQDMELFIQRLTNLSASELGKLRHKHYTDGDIWKAQTARRMWMDSDTCQKCRKPAKVVHHLTYERNYGKEDIFDLVSLCMGCHEELERMKREGQDPPEFILIYNQDVIEPKGNSLWTKKG